MSAAPSPSHTAAQIAPEDMRLYRLWRGLPTGVMTAKQADATIGRLANLWHDDDGQLADLAGVQALRTQMVLDRVLIERWGPDGKATYERVAEFPASQSFVEVQNRQLEIAQAQERQRFAEIDEASKRRLETGPWGIQQQAQVELIREVLRQSGAEDLDLDAIVEEARAEARAATREEVLALLGDLDRPLAARIRSKLQESRDSHVPE